jgi:mannose-6-phosphate isomerase-like protein (cupin superfamily)
MRKRIALSLSLIAGYLVTSCIFNYLIFPEPFADSSDLPRSGTTLVNEGIHSKFVYRQTSIETAGRLFEWDNFVDPSGGPSEIPHVHPHMREVFQIVDGELRFVLDGQERVAKAGDTVVAEPGTVHAFKNVSGKPAHMISRFEAAEDGPWERLAEEGLLPDSTFVQIDRAGGLGRVSPVQMLVFGTRHKQGYPPRLPTWTWDAIEFLVAPTARLFGVHVYYPPHRAPA